MGGQGGRGRGEQEEGEATEVIERLQASLRALANESASGPDEARDERLRDDCADALRLALDCMQQELTRPQREALSLLYFMLEDSEVQHGAVRRAASDACSSLGISI